VVESSGLENRQGFTTLVGSNPTSSANFQKKALRIANLVKGKKCPIIHPIDGTEGQPVARNTML
jgi:hypothetical protein